MIGHLDYKLTGISAMLIIMKTLTGERYELNVNPWDTIEAVKHALNKMIDTPAKQHYILYNNTLLDDSRTIENYNINDEETLYVLSHYNNKYSSLIITLQKADTPDDVLSIVPDCKSYGYSGVFTQSSISNGHIFHLEPNGLLPYIANFFASIAYDSSGCSYVQIDCPAYPSVIIERKNIHMYASVLYDQLRGLESEWPVEFLRVSA